MRSHLTKEKEGREGGRREEERGEKEQSRKRVIERKREWSL